MRATTSAPSLFSNNLNQKSDDDDGGEDAEKVLIWRRRKNLLQTMMNLKWGRREEEEFFLLFFLSNKTTHLGTSRIRSTDSSYILNRESNERVKSANSRGSLPELQRKTSWH